MKNDICLQISNVDLFYGASHVLHGIDLTLDKQPLAILGRNGMGKTSLCNTILGLQPNAGGSIKFFGTELVGLSPEKRANLGIGYVPQGRRVFRSLTVEEHFKIVEQKNGNWTKDRVYDTFPRLKERRKNYGDRLSGGEQQMLAIGRALLLNPKLIVFDEPTEGLAPAIVEDVINLVQKISEEGIAVLLVEQNMHAALKAVDQVAIMVGGQVVESMTAEALKNDVRLQKQHLGLEQANH